MKWEVRGAHLASGKDVRFTVDAATEQDAERVASARRVAVAEIVPLPGSTAAERMDAPEPPTSAPAPPAMRDEAAGPPHAAGPEPPAEPPMPPEPSGEAAGAFAHLVPPGMADPQRRGWPFVGATTPTAAPTPAADAPDPPAPGRERPATPPEVRSRPPEPQPSQQQHQRPAGGDASRPFRLLGEHWFNIVHVCRITWQTRPRAITLHMSDGQTLTFTHDEADAVRRELERYTKALDA